MSTSRPRTVDPMDTESVEIESPPLPSHSSKQSLFFTIGPSFTMMIPMILSAMFTMYNSQNTVNGSSFTFVGILTSIASAFIGVFWALLSYRYSQNQEKELERKRLSMYQKYINLIEEIIQKYTYNRQIIERQYPVIAECLGWVFGNNRRLWERSYVHTDFLTIRFGIGDMISPSKIVVPKERFTLIDDNIAQKPYYLQNEYKYLRKVPIGISLLSNLCIGLVSQKDDECLGFGRTV